MEDQVTIWIDRREGEAFPTAGWEYGLPPGISPAQWPRSRASGLPLMHGFTIQVPPRFRAKGADRVALSYFHPGDSESFPSEEAATARVGAILAGGALDDGEKGHPFWEALREHALSSHPATVYHTDILEHDHAIVWHTEAELRGPRCPRPETPLPEGIDGEAMHLDEPVGAEHPLCFLPREPQRVFIQLGWPLHPVQADPDELEENGFGAMVMEIETDVGGVNYGDGNCQIDLENGLLDWACT